MTTKKNKKAVLFLLLATFVICIAILIVSLIQQRLFKNIASQQDFVEVSEVMTSLDFTKGDGFTYSKQETEDLIINIEFDLDNKKITKNGYTFQIEDYLSPNSKTLYVDKKVLENVTNSSIELSKKKTLTEPMTYDREMIGNSIAPLVAHAGGTYRTKNSNLTYTNSIDALVQNYDIGHRVFEFDFYLTSDNKLAAVHDWEQFGNKNGVALSSQEWASWSETPENLQQIFITDILDQMMINKDMFLITDTKSFEISDEEILEQFTVIYEEAMKRDEELLNRIMPQIYNEEMLELINQIYKYPNIVFTLYATPASTEEILMTLDKQPQIKIVTLPSYSFHYEDDNLINGIIDRKLMMFGHTVNTFSDFSKHHNRGIEGAYTDNLTPYEWFLWSDLNSGYIME